MTYFNLDKSQCARCSLVLFCTYSNNADIHTKQRKLKRKEKLHTAGDAFTSIYAIKQGALKIHETDPAGNELIRGLYLKNEVYGYDAIFKERYPFSSTALTETVICEILYQDVLLLIQSEPLLLSRILYLMSQQLMTGIYLKFITAQQRLAAFLIDLSTRLSKNGEMQDFLLPMSYQDVGCYLGLATETVSRTLSKFKKSQFISIENKHIYFLKPDELKQIADGF